MRTIGLIGGIGSGKTAVTGILAELGAHVIHADAVGHDVYRPGSAGWDAVVAAFGDDVVGSDGSIDRKRLGALVFADPARLKQLNAIVHPLISAEIKHRIDTLRAQASSSPVVIEAAILIEAGWRSLVDEVWLVIANRDAVVTRLSTQRGLSADDVGRRVDAQLNDSDRRQHARFVIENTGSLADLRERVRAAWEKSCGGSD